jgi:hypothetical protein
LGGLVKRKSDIETIYEDFLWKVRREGSFETLVASSNRSEAVDAGRHVAIADRVDHIIRDVDGAIEQRNSYRDLP